MKFIRIIWVLSGLIFFAGPLAGQVHQVIDFEVPVPLDSTVRLGKLSNGFTYYIRKNNKPAGKVQMNLIVNAGRFHEDDSQLGLAHFVEHMGFNELDHFPRLNQMIDYLDSSGVKRGSERNASTGHVTNYLLILPTSKPGLVDTGYLIMRDWAQGIIFSAASVDLERSAVLAEIQMVTGGSVGKGFSQKEARFMNHPKYKINGKSIEASNIKNFKMKEAERFYKDWYRPDLEAAIIVGDIDVDQVDKKIQATFSDLKMPLIPRQSSDKLKAWKVSLDGKNKFLALTDPEINKITLSIYNKIKRNSDSIIGIIVSKEDYKSDIIRKLYNILMRERFETMTRQYNSPVENVQHYWDYYFQWYTGLDCISTTLTLNGPKQIKRAFEQVMIEMERIRQYGFSDSELVKAKREVLQELENNKLVTTSQFVNALVSHFSEGSAVPSPEEKLQLQKQLLDETTSEEISQQVKEWVTSINRDVFIEAPSKYKSQLPDGTSIEQWAKAIKSFKLEPYKAPSSPAKNLLEENEQPIKTSLIIRREKEKNSGISMIRLNNGVELILKPLNKKNESSPKSRIITINGFRKGGFSMYHDNDQLNAMYAPQIVRNAGVGKFDKFQLDEFLKEKSIDNVNIYMDENFNNVQAIVDYGNIETILQLIYLNFQTPRKDAIAFEDWRNNMLANLPVKDVRDFFREFENIVQFARMGKTWSGNKITKEAFSKIQINKAYKIYQENFCDPAGYTFIIHGDFEEEAVIPLLIKYLGGIPSVNKEGTGFVLNGKTSHHYIEGNNDRAVVKLDVKGCYEYNSRNNILLELLSITLDRKIYDRLRNKEGAVYHPKAQVGYYPSQPGTYSFMINFDCNPDKTDYLINSALDEIEKLRIGSFSPELLQLAVLEYRRKITENENNEWQEYLKQKYQNGQNPITPDETQVMLNSITIDDVQGAAAKYLNLDNLQRMVWLPKDKHSGKK